MEGLAAVFDTHYLLVHGGSRIRRSQHHTLDFTHLDDGKS